MSHTRPASHRLEHLSLRASNLPNEILDDILISLGFHDLASSSLVSRTWRTIAFRHLYHTVHLTLKVDLKRFSERLSYERDKPLSVALFTRRLVLDDTCNDRTRDIQNLKIDQADCHLLVAIIPALARLEHFSCRLFNPRNPQLSQVLQKCHIKSIDWEILLGFGEFDYFEDNYQRFFDFQGLSHFKLDLMRIYDNPDGELDDPDEDCDKELDLIISLVHACPNLESLELDLFAQEHLCAAWSLNNFITALNSWTSPNLQTFRALGEVHWLTFSTCSDFFRRHPRLHTISLGWMKGSLRFINFVPDEMPALFPSLKHLEGPASLCGLVLASSLAKQIESVTVLYGGEDDSNSNLSYIASVVSHLPRLHKLVLKGATYYYDGLLPAEPLKTIICAAPALKELELHWNLDDPKKIIDALKVFSNLRVLATRSDMLEQVSMLFGNAQIDGRWEFYVPWLARIYPRLRCVKDMECEDNYAYWVIDRNFDGEIEVNRRTFY